VKRLELEVFESRVVHRSQLNPAPYNPKIITKPAYTKLEEVLRHHKLVERLVWNERTGHLVGGHQRLRALDAADPALDYSIPVAVVNKSLEDEISLNVLLSNPEAMGEDDIQLLSTLIGDIGHKHTGYDEVDLGLLGIATKGIFAEDPNAELVAHVQGVLDAGKAIDKAYQQAKQAAVTDAADELRANSEAVPLDPLDPATNHHAGAPNTPAEPHQSAFHPETAPAGATDIAHDAYRRQMEVSRQKQLEQDHREKATAKRDNELNFFCCLVFTDPADQASFYKLFNLPPGGDNLFGEGILQQLEAASLKTAL